VPTDGTSFAVRFVPVTAQQTSRRRVHLDLTTSSDGDQVRSAEELVGLGGRHVDLGQSPDEGHLVLADPEDNLFCLIEPDNRFLAGCPRLGCVNGDGRRETGVFWSRALGWPLIWDQDDETAIRSPEGTGPVLSWGGSPLGPKDGDNRLWLELTPELGRSVDDEVDRLVRLGAELVVNGPERAQLRDPDGNELVVRPAPVPLDGRQR
jgi:hypothetical protein